MKNIIFASLVIICAIVVVISFFIPWARANVSATKVATGLTASAASTLANTPFAGKFVRGLDTATTAINELGDITIKTQVSGYDIPTLVNKKSSKIALSLFGQSPSSPVNDSYVSRKSYSSPYSEV